MTRPDFLPLVDLRRMHDPIAKDLGEAFARVVASSRYLLGPETEAFEAEFARHEGGGTGVCCGSGSDALYLALRALDVGPGDAVVTVSNSFVATPESIARTGARVVFCDAHPATRSLDPADLARILDEPGADAIKAVIPIHLYGRRADCAGIREVLESAERNDIWLIGDAAQSHASPDVSQDTDLTCYSFYPGKNLGALGDGGFVISKTKRHANRIRSLRNHGRAGKHRVSEVGVNSRFDDIQAACLRVKLKHLRQWTQQRRAIADAYRERLSAHSHVMKLPADDPRHVYHLFVVELTLGTDASVRDRVFNQMIDEHQVGVGLHYPVPCHQMAPYPTERALPVAEHLSNHVLSLPCFPGMTYDEVDRTVSALERSLSLRPPGITRSTSTGAVT
ncbi:MAG: DegT/DnrJ/EryC1/StrS family aminotransferase [Deltaproteobacteria bacterium]|nr:DegT/DnrJ/EryC1/StrS family aminotransferase [Deltaproteobacteria bacterium]